MSCFCIAWLRRKATWEARTLGQEAVASAPVIMQEWLVAASGPGEREGLRFPFASLPMWQATAGTCAAARTLHARCREKGFTPRCPHVGLIAQPAVGRDVPRLREEWDFEARAGIEPKLKRVAP